MKNENMNKQRKQMDKVKLTNAADPTIGNGLLDGYTRNNASHRTWAKRNLSAAMIIAIILIASSVTV